MKKDHWTVRLSSEALDEEHTQVREVYGSETISQLFRFDVHVVSAQPDGVRDSELLRHPATLVFERQNEGGIMVVGRKIHGMVCSVRDRLMSGEWAHEYFLEFVPRAWESTLTVTTDVYQNMSVPEIVSFKLEQAGLVKGSDVQWRLNKSYPKREFTVQYRESDLAFISRLCEHLGIFFFFEHDNGKGHSSGMLLYSATYHFV